MFWVLFLLGGEIFFFFLPPSFRLGSQLEDGSFIKVNVDGGGGKQFE